MAFEIQETELPGVLIIETNVFQDERGFFWETYNNRRYAQAGLDRCFVQDNHSRSARGVLRGLHYQLNNPQGKMVSVIRGEIFDVAVDIRQGSPTFGKWFGTVLSEQNHRQLFVPEGFAHGFCVMSEIADVTYKCTALYTPGDEYGVLWSDETLGIKWPVEEALLSAKDLKNPVLTEADPANLPVYKGD